MTNDGFDAVLARRVRECAAGKHLPSDFSDRFVTTLRRRRRARHFKMVALIVALTLVCGLFISFTAEKPTCRSTETALVSTDKPMKNAQSSGWMLLGFFRECFRRNKTGKKKEEEQ